MLSPRAKRALARAKRALRTREARRHVWPSPTIAARVLSGMKSETQNSSKEVQRSLIHQVNAMQRALLVHLNISHTPGLVFPARIDGVDRLYVVSPSRCSRRRALVIEELGLRPAEVSAGIPVRFIGADGALGMDHLRRVAANVLDGELGFARNNPYKPNGSMTPGEVGAALSHLLAWQDMWSQRPPVRAALVVEDDFAISAAAVRAGLAASGLAVPPRAAMPSARLFAAFVGESVRQLSAPPTASRWDLLYMSWQPINGAPSPPPPPGLSTSGPMDLSNGPAMWWMRAYVLRRSGARKLVAARRAYLGNLIAVDDWLACSQWGAAAAVPQTTAWLDCAREWAERVAGEQRIRTFASRHCAARSQPKLKTSLTCGGLRTCSRDC